MGFRCENRSALMRRLPDGLILLSGGREIIRNNDVSYVFRQSSDFLYLTGVEEPNCHLLLEPKRRRATLYIPKVDKRYRVWRGDTPGPAEARKLYGFPRVAYSDVLAKDVRKAKRPYRKIFADKTALKALAKELRGLKTDPAGLHDALQELRAVKSEAEIELLRRANKISGRAHVLAMRSAKPGMREYEVQAVFESACRRAGLKHLAYPSIVASGTGAAVLHYEKNDAPLKAGELLLMDAGAELHGYAADITRTFPVSKRFSRRQRDVYSIVLETQKECIRLARPGITSAELHVRSMRMIAEGLKDLKILKGGTDDLVESGAVSLFYPHGLGHLLGLDVHDGDGGRRRKVKNPTKVPIRYVTRLEAGFVVTVEPGIYFIEALLTDGKLRRKHARRVDFRRAESFLDFGGIRIEDDIVIRRGAPFNLTSVPKEIGEVEDLRAEAR